MNTISHDGDLWEILGQGVTREDGKTYCHLASATRKVRQRNGLRPIQIADWVSLACCPPGQEGNDGESALDKGDCL